MTKIGKRLQNIIELSIKFINKDRCLNKKVKNILCFFIYSVLSLILFFVLLLDEIYPFNLILIGLIAVFIVLVSVSIFLFGKIVLRKNFFLYLLLFVIILISCCLNLFATVQKTIFLIILFSAFLSVLFVQDFLNKKTILFSFLFVTWIVLLIFTVVERNGIIHPNFSSRIGYSFGDQNYVARDLSFCLLLNSMGLIMFGKKTKWFLLIPIVLSLYYILLTGSISNLLVLICCFAIIIGIKIPKKKRIWYLVSLAAIVIFFVFLINLPVFSYFKTRIDGMIAAFTGKGKSDASFVNRFIVSQYGVSLWLSRPMFGNGYSSVYRNYFIMAHNNLVEVLADYGIFAFLIEEALLICPIVYILKTKKYDVKTRMIVLLLSLYMLLLQPFLVEIDSKAEMIFLPLCYYFLEPLATKKDFMEANCNENRINCKYYEIEI